jgi:hypothetical protein
MQKKIFIICLGVFFINILNAQDLQKQNYITSGYYQLVYEADIAYLEGNKDLAFEKLQEAEKRCELLNQFSYGEMEIYSILLFEKGDFSKAIYYMEKLAIEYGREPYLILMAIQDNSVIMNNLLIEFPTFYDTIIADIIQKSENFYTPKRDSLVAILTEMTDKDQLLRQNWEVWTKQPDSAKYAQQLNEIDEQNKKDFLEFVEKYSFPNLQLFGLNMKNISMESSIRVMLMHLCENLEIQKIILQNIEHGKCSPLTFASVIDRCLLNENKSLYAIYENVKDETIIDILNLNNRRMAIGMPTREMERKKNVLRMQQNE